MRGGQLARQWRILRTIESRKIGAIVAELAAQENCRSRTFWRHLGAIQNAQLPLLSQFNPMHDSQHQLKAQLATRVFQRETHSMTIEVGGLCQVMSWVLGFGRQAEVLEPEHLREAVAEEVTGMAERYGREAGEIATG